MIELNVTQGSAEWHAARAKCLNASDAPAMMGVSQYKTRSALVAEKATGIAPEVDAATQARFDMGHEVEALARPLAEKIIGEELYPVVATDNSGKYLASSDGATMLMDVGFEHKAWNEKLAAEVAGGNVPESHRWQLDHQFMVFGFAKILFVVSNGTPEKMVHCWYYPRRERINALIEGWNQFEKDVAAYVPEQAKPSVVAEKVEGLPALFVQVEGRVVSSNMGAFKDAAELFLSSLPKADQLQTDQDFANADQAAKDCKDAEEKLQIVKAQAQSQAVSIDEAFRAIDSISEKIRAARLSLEKVVKAEKENRKAEIVREAALALNKHYADLTSRIGMQMPMFNSNFADAIKGLKSLDSMRDKVSVALANAKIEANAMADRIDANRKTVEDMSLFPDFANVCMKAPEDFAALLSMRIAQRKEAEEKRLEAERERIRAEEQAKAQREAAAQAAAERAEQNRKAEEELRRLNAERAAAQQAAAAEAIAALPKIEPANDASPMIKLGEINARLGYTVSAEFLSSLGFEATTERNAKLYRESAWPSICRKIADHTMALAFKKAA